MTNKIKLENFCQKSEKFDMSENHDLSVILFLTIKCEKFLDLESKIKSIQDIWKEVGHDEKHNFFRF